MRRMKNYMAFIVLVFVIVIVSYSMFRNQNNNEELKNFCKSNHISYDLVILTSEYTNELTWNIARGFVIAKDYEMEINDAIKMICPSVTDETIEKIIDAGIACQD